ncbi:MAG TPA: rhodanese-like domain-containing protein [Actinomycetota bacterium]|nr:rhodanese-like domain-containing protein [Actinomycetota bacterium]
MVEKGAMDLVKEAKQQVENLTPEQVASEVESGDAVLVDLREPQERENGVIPGAMSAPRGMLEFYADPSLPYHKEELQRDRRVILHCASGGRSALAAKTLKEMGYTNVAHLDGGIKAWQEAGQPVEQPR